MWHSPKKIGRSKHTLTLTSHTPTHFAAFSIGKYTVLREMLLSCKKQLFINLYCSQKQWQFPRFHSCPLIHSSLSDSYFCLISFSSWNGLVQHPFCSKPITLLATFFTKFSPSNEKPEVWKLNGYGTLSEIFEYYRADDARTKCILRGIFVGSPWIIPLFDGSWKLGLESLIVCSEFACEDIGLPSSALEIQLSI